MPLGRGLVGVRHSWSVAGVMAGDLVPLGRINSTGEPPNKSSGRVQPGWGWDRPYFVNINSSGWIRPRLVNERTTDVTKTITTTAAPAESTKRTPAPVVGGRNRRTGKLGRHRWLFIAGTLLAIGGVVTSAGCASTNGAANSGAHSGGSQYASDPSTSASENTGTGGTGQTTAPPTSPMTTKPPTHQSSRGVSLIQIANGDYSSLNGRWVNSEGKFYVIVNGKITPGPTTNTATLTKPDIEDGTAWIGITPNYEDSRVTLKVIPKNFSPSPVDICGPDEKCIDQSDSSKDRMIVSTNGGLSVLGGRQFAPDWIYYRTADPDQSTKTHTPTMPAEVNTKLA